MADEPDRLEIQTILGHLTLRARTTAYAGGAIETMVDLEVDEEWGDSATVALNMNEAARVCAFLQRIASEAQ